jgi:serine/threonine protein phosphatase PrpC
MSSQDAVDYCHNNASHNEDPYHFVTKKEMAQHLVQEALKRGSMDNISVVIIWLSK